MAARSSSKLFVIGILSVLLAAALLTYWLATESEPPALASDVHQEGAPAWAGMSAEARRRWLQAQVAKQTPPPAEDDPGAPPFQPLFEKELRVARGLLEKQVAAFSLWQHYERCRAEHASTGKDAKQSHEACLVWYNRALWDQLDIMVRLVEEEGNLESFRRLRFHREVVLGEVDRILKESSNVVERVMALKLLERGGLLDAGAQLAPEIYRRLGTYSHPEVALLLDPRLPVPADEPQVAEALAHFAAEPQLAVETANRAAITLGRSAHAEKLNDVATQVLDRGWEKEMSLMPRGLAEGLGICGSRCAAGFERVARDADDPFVATLLYDALFAIRDRGEKHQMARRIEAMLPPLESLLPEDREARANVFANLYR